MSPGGPPSGTYAGWDRFGRTRQQFWTGYSGTANVDRVYYDYDYASNRLYSDIDSAIHSGNNRDQAYTYDSAHRLKTFDQGTLSGSTITGTPTQEQDWSLDGLGNWSNYVTKTSGTTALNQDRTANKVNEITDITESVGPAWVTPGYDAAGSMTTIPQPGNLTAGYTATFDAWHRLVKLANGGTTVAEYEYDATKQRIVKKIYVSGVLDETQYFFYNDNWQVLETKRDEEPPLAQYVWHPYYIDALLLRDYDEDAQGIGVVRYYYTQDVNFNVLSILSSTGTVLERYVYTPYGQAGVLTASFTADSDGLSDSKNDITFTGQRYDSESRLMLYRHRYYHPVLGTFCSRDPIGYEGSQWNLYEYVGGQPTIATDPSGKAGPAVIVVGGVTIGVGTVIVGVTIGVGLVQYYRAWWCVKKYNDCIDNGNNWARRCVEQHALEDPNARGLCRAIHNVVVINICTAQFWSCFRWNPFEQPDYGRGCLPCDDDDDDDDCDDDPWVEPDKPPTLNEQLENPIDIAE